MNREPLSHGASGYRNFGCRCDVCRASERNRKRRQHADRLVRTAIPADAHGRYSTYNNWLCRCEPCRAAWAAYRKELRSR